MKKLWFRRKLYGWGWYPSSWEGWVAILIYAAVITKIVVLANTNIYSANDVALRVVLPSIVSTVILIMVCFKKGESPRWQWGEREEDK